MGREKEGLGKRKTERAQREEWEGKRLKCLDYIRVSEGRAAQPVCGKFRVGAGYAR